MALSTADHRAIHRQVKDTRNRGARYLLAQQRGQELAALRKEVARLRRMEMAARALFAPGVRHEGLDAEQVEALRNALGLSDK